MCRIDIARSKFAWLQFCFIRCVYLFLPIRAICVNIVKFSSKWKQNIAFQLKTPFWVRFHLFLISFMWVPWIRQFLDLLLILQSWYLSHYLCAGASLYKYIDTDRTNRQRCKQQSQMEIIHSPILWLLAEIANKGRDPIFCWSSKAHIYNV